jgi:hypothetical protein
MEYGRTVRLAWRARGPGGGEGSRRARPLSENDRARGFRSRTRAPAAVLPPPGRRAVCCRWRGFALARRVPAPDLSRAEHGDADGDRRSIGSASQRRTDLSRMRRVRRTPGKLGSVSGSVFTVGELDLFVAALFRSVAQRAGARFQWAVYAKSDSRAIFVYGRVSVSEGLYGSLKHYFALTCFSKLAKIHTPLTVPIFLNKTHSHYMDDQTKTWCIVRFERLFQYSD